jgi:predicted transcriptional regulator
MTGMSRRPAGALEADVLGVLWAADEPLSPADVRDALGADLAYTTVMTVLARLYDKGLLERHRVGRGYVYAPAVHQAALAAQRMRELLEGDPDREAVLARFVGSLTPTDLSALRDLLRRRQRASR